MRYLAIDHGLKRIGLAICDEDEIICSPAGVIENSPSCIDRLVEIINSYSPSAVVLGLPLNMDGSLGSQAQCVKDFAKQLSLKIDLPIHFHDERLSSFDAEDKLSELSRKKRKKHLDSVAAASILQSFLDSKS